MFGLLGSTGRYKGTRILRFSKGRGAGEKGIFIYYSIIVIRDTLNLLNVAKACGNTDSPLNLDCLLN